MPIHLNLVAIAQCVVAFFVGVASHRPVEALLKAQGLLLRTDDLSWGLCLPGAVTALTLDLAWRFAHRKVAPGPLWHPLTGGHVFILPVWLIGFVTIAAWGGFAYVDAATH